MFGVIHVANFVRVDLAAYRMKNVARTWFEQWKGVRDEGTPLVSLSILKEAFL